MHSCLSLSVPLVLTLIFYFLTHCIREFDAKSLLLPLTYFILTLYRVLFIFLILWVGLIISVNITNVVWLASVKERIFFLHFLPWCRRNPCEAVGEVDSCQSPMHIFLVHMIHLFVCLMALFERKSLMLLLPGLRFLRDLVACGIIPFRQVFTLGLLRQDVSALIDRDTP